jgi:hypothetical protein
VGGDVTKTSGEWTEARKGDTTTFSSMAVLPRVLIYVRISGYVYLCCVYVSWIDEKSVRSPPEQSSSESRIDPPFLAATSARTSCAHPSLNARPSNNFRLESPRKRLNLCVCGCVCVCVLRVCFVCMCTCNVCVQYTHTNTHNSTG